MSAPHRLKTLLVAAVGGFLAHVAFPGISIWPAAMIGLAMLMWSLQRDSATWAFAVGTVWGTAHFLPLLWWAHEAVGPLPWIALSIFEAMILALGPVIYVWLRRLSMFTGGALRLPLLFAAGWVVAEQIRHQWPFGGFPWVRIAFSQMDGPLITLAPFGGAPLVSFVVALIGGLLSVAVLSAAVRDITRTVVAVFSTAVILLAPLLIGVDVRAENGHITVGAVQGNVANPGLDAFANAREVTGNHRDGTLRLAQEAGELDLVLWPENASDYDPRTDMEARQMVNDAQSAVGVPLLVGTVRYEEDTRYNEIVVWNGPDDVGDAYAKQVPAAFAEYIPLRELIRPIAPVVDMVGTDMTAGTDSALLEVFVDSLGREIKVATIICFEVAYDWLNTEAVAKGAEFLFVPTNNASFGETAESVQQLGMTRFRAVEHGRAAIQISTVGVSGYAAPDGSLHSVTELFTADEFAVEIPLRTSLTWATRLGQWPIYTLMVVTFAGMVTAMISYRVPKKRSKG